jgi:lipopolysaccharide/colanic/teichoic acid biosynthesis glycosyltransferase
MKDGRSRMQERTGAGPHQSWSAGRIRGVATGAPVIVYGCGPLASLLLETLRRGPSGGFRVVGMVEEDGGRTERHVAQVPILGQASELDRILVDLAVNGVKPERIIVASDHRAMNHATVAQLEAARSRHGLPIDYLHDEAAIESLWPFTTRPQAPRAIVPPTRYERFRRAADVIVSALALLLLAPLLVVLAFVVLFDVGPPLLFLQTRPGRHMQPFVLYKFRTMRPSHDGQGKVLLDAERTSRIGRFLRRTRLDELPQFYNVLVGDMSLIGPRPLLPRDLPHDFTERCRMRPGITGWAQVNGGHQLTAANKLLLDLWYVERANFWLDAYIVWRTLKTMLLGEKVDHAALAAARSTLVASGSTPGAASDTSRAASPAERARRVPHTDHQAQPAPRALDRRPAVQRSA